MFKYELSYLLFFFFFCIFLPSLRQRLHFIWSHTGTIIVGCAIIHLVVLKDHQHLPCPAHNLLHQKRCELDPIVCPITSSPGASDTHQI